MERYLRKMVIIIEVAKVLALGIDEWRQTGNSRNWEASGAYSVEPNICMCVLCVFVYCVSVCDITIMYIIFIYIGSNAAGPTECGKPMCVWFRVTRGR